MLSMTSKASGRQALRSFLVQIAGNTSVSLSSIACRTPSTSNFPDETLRSPLGKPASSAGTPSPQAGHLLGHLITLGSVMLRVTLSTLRPFADDVRAVFEIPARPRDEIDRNGGFQLQARFHFPILAGLDSGMDSCPIVPHLISAASPGAFPGFVPAGCLTP